MFEEHKKRWVGKEVISISNAFETEPDNPSMNVGTVTDIIPITQSNSPIPIVIFENDPEPKLCFSCLMEYSDELYDALSKLTAAERYLIVQNVVHRMNLKA